MKTIILLNDELELMENLSENEKQRLINDLKKGWLIYGSQRFHNELRKLNIDNLKNKKYLINHNLIKFF